MSDIIDQANDNIEREMQARLASRRPQVILPTGLCLNCDDDVGDARLFCCVECRDDFDRRQRLQKKPA